MNRLSTRTALVALAILVPAAAAPALAQYDQRYGAQSGEAPAAYESRGGLLDGLFGRRERAPREEPARQAQMSASDLAMRLERLENTIRQLTGAIEQLQHRNQQLEQQFKRNQEDVEYRLQELGSKGPPAARRQPASQPAAQTSPPPAAPGRRSDVFDPNAAPDAPGAPQTLGSIPASAGGPPPIIAEEEPVGAPGGRAAGAPLDLGTLAERDPQDPPPASTAPAGASAEPRAIPGMLPPPPPRTPSATGGRQQLAVAPSATPRDEFALAYGYLQRRDYALAEKSLREFLQRHPSDRMAPEAHYWLGESLFQRQRYRDAAESFLTVSTKYERSGKASEALLRLGQSLAALGEREAACATLGEVVRRYPKSTVSVKQSVEREQKRARC